MELRTLSEIPRVEVKREKGFRSLGFVTHSKPDMLVYIELPKYLDALLCNPAISGVITKKDLAKEIPEQFGLAISPVPRETFYQFHNYLAAETDFYWKDFPNEISKEVLIHPTANIASKNVRIGGGTIIEAGVNILERSLIGGEVILRTGCTIGSEGFMFERLGSRVMRVIHGGGVKLGDRVEVQAHGAIDRSVFGGVTEIGEDTKMDNLVHIAHDVFIGKRCLLAANAMIAGSARIEEDVWVGPSAAISSGITIGKGATITIGSVVTLDVDAGRRVTGNFAVDHEKFISFIRGFKG